MPKGVVCVFERNGLDPQIIKDLDDMREKCRSALPANERNSNGEQRVRPKSSMNSSITRTPSASRSSNNLATRPKSSKGARAEKKLPDQQALARKKPTSNGSKHRQDELDDAEDNAIRMVDDEEIEDDDDGEENNIRITNPVSLFLQ